MNITVHLDNFHNRVLNWVYSMQTAPTQFRMNKGADSTIFTTCFALFIFDLFGEVKSWPQEERDTWIDFINSFQDKDSGYFIPDNYNGELNAKPVQQLTVFCLDALDILSASPRYDPYIPLKQWSAPQKITDYLNKIGCFKGYPTTGNMAMFLGILLTRKYLRDGKQSDKELIESWFKTHEKTQNSSTGFWGNSLSNKYYHGFQNAFHQFVIYNYWKRPIAYHKKIVDTVLSLQDQDGFFAPIPGGGGCWDFDAADILIHCGYQRRYRHQEIAAALTKLFFATLDSQNQDGGFCESQKRPPSMKNAINAKNLRFIFAGQNPYLWYCRLRSTLSIARNKRRQILTHWTRRGRRWDQSDLWNTWFRCLTLAEISQVIGINHFLREFDWNFHKNIGLGYFKLIGDSQQTVG